MNSQPPESPNALSKLRSIASISLFIILSLGVLFLAGNFVLALMQKFAASSS